MLKTIVCMLLLTAGHAAAACDKSLAGESDFPGSLTQTTTTAISGIVSAWYDGATDRYRHGVLGDAIEPSILRVTDTSGCTISVELDDEHVFEDIETRLADIDNLPGAEVITIRSNQNKGAQIAVYKLSDQSELQLLATTPYIGTAHRWLAPVGIADFNNDGNTDIAFVDRPHLARVLRVWTYKDAALHQTASQPGYTNHRIGEDFISGGIKHCGDAVTMITADADWNRVLETRLVGKQLISEDIGPFENTGSLSTGCPE